MPSFEEIGLREDLLQILEDDEFAAPTALQQAVIPTLRRGGNLVARASSGSGKTLAYTLGILDRLAADGGSPEADADAAATEEAVRVLVLTATPAEAERVGMTMTRYADPLGLRVAVLGPGWGTRPEEAAIIVSAAGDIMDTVRSSGVKLESLEAIVIDGASAILELGHWDEVDGLMDLLPRDTQRVLISTVLKEEVEDLAGRRVKKALRYPSEAAVPDPAPAAEATIGYVLAGDREKLDLLAMQLHGRTPGTSPPIIFCRSDERAAQLAEQLAIRGFLVGDAGDPDADVALATGGVTLEELAEDVDGEVGQTISYDVPADSATLRHRHHADDAAVVLTEPRELAHLREISAPAGFRLRAAPLGGIEGRSLRELTTFRNEVRRLVESEDLTPQMLVLEPLLAEFSAIEVAAALAVLARRRSGTGALPGSQDAASSGAGAGSPAGERSPREGAAPAGAGREKAGRTASRTPDSGRAPVTWARLFVGIGSRDDVRPGDLVGGLAGEADIPGSTIGKIEIRDSFSIVEVQADVADQVIRAVNGTTLKGRAVRVDYDRGGPARRPDSRGSSPRRTTRRPPR